MSRIRRSEILDRLRALKARGEPIIGAGAGTGISAKGEELGGADLIVIYNSGRYRMAGRGSLAGMMPFGDANGVVLEMAREVLPVVGKTPVLAGVCGTDPFRQMDVFLDEVARLGFSGVQNFPTVGLIDGRFRAGLEETGMGYACEVEMVAKAHARDLLTTPYVFEPAQAAAMARAGADVLVCHFGLTVGGSIGAATSTRLEDCPALTDAMADAAFAVNRDILILVHGGPIAEPPDAEFVLARARHCHGFYGASSMERLPVERAMREQVAKFKAIKKLSASEEQARVRPNSRRAGRK
ncbi:MAG TPA: phosphoenolpyruvate hydrolase family protein [Xanthobacteraceae bacterium]|nr:phosphoenolpyruvate hydrolase family protein [Xanthobacteraceae bacterium]